MENKLQESTMLVSSGKYIEQINNYATQVELPFTQDERIRVMNAIRVIDPILKDNGLSWDTMDRNNVVNVLQQVAFLKVNPSAMPRECYFILRNKKTGKQDQYGKDTYAKEIEFGIEGAGNDRILRSFGEDVKDVKSYIVREGDEFQGVIYDGWEEKLPVYTPKYKSKKALYAVYMIQKKSTNEIVVSISEREDVKQSLLAHIRQNGADENQLRELAKESLDTLLTETKYVNGVIKKEKKSYNKDTKKWTVETYDVPLIGLAWTSAVSKEAVIERKLRNHATRRYPKNFLHADVNELYEETFEEERYPKQIVSPDETLQIEQQIFDEKANKEVLKPKKETVKKPVAKGEEFVVKKVEEQTTQTIDSTTGEVVEEEETVVEDVVIEEEIVEDKVVEVTKPIVSDEEDWMK